MQSIQQALTDAQARVATLEKENHTEEAQKVRSQIEHMQHWIAQPDTRPTRSMMPAWVHEIVEENKIDRNEFPV